MAPLIRPLLGRTKSGLNSRKLLHLLFELFKQRSCLEAVFSTNSVTMIYLSPLTKSKKKHILRGTD